MGFWLSLYIYNYIYIYIFTVKMVEDHNFAEALVSEMRTKHCKAIGPPKSDNGTKYWKAICPPKK